MKTNEQALTRNRKERHFYKQYTLVAYATNATLREFIILRYYHVGSNHHCVIYIRPENQSEIVGGGKGTDSQEALRDCLKSIDAKVHNDPFSTLESIANSLAIENYNILIANG